MRGRLPTRRNLVVRANTAAWQSAYREVFQLPRREGNVWFTAIGLSAAPSKEIPLNTRFSLLLALRNRSRVVHGGVYHHPFSDVLQSNHSDQPPFPHHRQCRAVVLPQ